MSVANAWLISLCAAIAFMLAMLVPAVKDLLRTLKRIEARMTLLNPLEEERKILEGSDILDSSTRWDIRDRAIQPDIWWRLYYGQIKDLAGKDRKDAQKGLKRRERRSRS